MTRRNEAPELEESGCSFWHRCEERDSLLHTPARDTRGLRDSNFGILIVRGQPVLLGFGGIVAEAALIAKILPFAILILLVVAIIMGRKGLSSGQ